VISVKLLAQENGAGRTLRQAYLQCAELAKTHYENFPVASWLLPKSKRPHIYSIYAYCRTVDDLGDEYEGERLQALDAWEQDLLRCYDGTPRHPYMIALQQTIREFDIPSEPFLMLVGANRLDQTTTRHATYEDLEYYCRHSANPVGRLVLYVFGYRDPERQNLSDSTCTALQLANFWQDVSRDYAMGRIYLPQEDMARFGYAEEMIADGTFNREFRDLMAFEVERARDLFRRGLKLVGTLEGRLKLDVALFSLGGMRVLDAIERQGYNVLGMRPKISKAARLRLMLTTALRLKMGFGV
jgi:squalene synthase HpnC